MLDFNELRRIVDEAKPELSDVEILLLIIIAERVESFAEIGVGTGRVARYLLRYRGFLRDYYAVDLWEAPREDREMMERIAVSVREMREVWDFLHIFREDSISVSHRFLDESLDMVYIDADPSPAGVLGNVRAWARKVRPEGILAGRVRKSNGDLGLISDFLGESPEVFETVWLLRVKSGFRP